MNSKKTDYEIMRNMLANSIGMEVLDFVESLDIHRLDSSVESQAQELLSQIKDILNDQTLTDPVCFRKIEAIVEAFEKKGVSISRHDW